MLPNMQVGYITNFLALSVPLIILIYEKTDQVTKLSFSLCALGCLEIVVNIVFFVFRGFAVPAFLCLTLSFS